MASIKHLVTLSALVLLFAVAAAYVESNHLKEACVRLVRHSSERDPFRRRCRAWQIQECDPKQNDVCCPPLHCVQILFEEEETKEEEKEEAKKEEAALEPPKKTGVCIPYPY